MKYMQMIAFILCCNARISLHAIRGYDNRFPYVIPFVAFQDSFVCDVHSCNRRRWVPPSHGMLPDRNWHAVFISYTISLCYRTSITRSSGWILLISHPVFPTRRTHTHEPTRTHSLLTVCKPADAPWAALGDIYEQKDVHCSIVRCKGLCRQSILLNPVPRSALKSLIYLPDAAPGDVWRVVYMTFERSNSD